MQNLLKGSNKNKNMNNNMLLNQNNGIVKREQTITMVIKTHA